MNLRNNKGFTIIELLVTIVLIAIISVIAFMNFGENSWKARNSMRKDALGKFTVALATAKADERTPTYPDCTLTGTTIGFSDLNSNNIAESTEPLISKTCKFSDEFIKANKMEGIITINGALKDPKTQEYYDFAVSNKGTIGSPQIGEEFQFKSTLETAEGNNDPYYAGNYANALIPLN